jgi:Replication-relaxation
MERKVYKFRKGRTGVWLMDKDIELMKLIWEHRILSLKELKFYSNALYDIKPGTLERKLQRWRDENIVTSKKYGDLTVYYRLAKNGYFILENEGEIAKGKYHYKELAAPANQTDHYFGIRDVVIRSLVEMRKLELTVTSLSPADVPYIVPSIEPNYPFVVPDWILKNKEHEYLNIELDTGNENLAAIEAKIEKYVKYASHRPSEIHHVMIVIMDNQDEFFKYQKDFGLDRQGRIANVKRVVIRANAQVHSNLKFFVSPMSRAHHMAFNILTGQSQITEEERSNEINAIQLLLTMNNKFKYEIEHLNASDFYLPDVPPALYADGHLLFCDKAGKKQYWVLLKIMEEGSARCLDELNYLNTLRIEQRFKKEVDRIIAIYRTSVEFENDSFGKPIMQHVIFTIKEQLMMDMDSEPFFKNVNQYKKGKGIHL